MMGDALRELNRRDAENAEKAQRVVIVKTSAKLRALRVSAVQPSWCYPGVLGDLAVRFSY